jgi:hypothetical protein
MSPRSRIAAALSVAAILAGTAVITPAAAEESPPENAFADVYGISAQVNRTGGISVSGLIDCHQAVERYEADNGPLPPGSVVNVAYDWVARQPLGRKGGYLVAGFGSSHLTACHKTATLDPVSPAVVEFAWDSTPYGMVTPVFVYSDLGKFTKSIVHVDVTMYGGYAPNGEEFANTQPGDGGDWVVVEVYNQTGVDVRPTSAR